MHILSATRGTVSWSLELAEYILVTARALDRVSRDTIIIILVAIVSQHDITSYLTKYT